MAATTSPLEAIRSTVASAAEKVYTEPVRADGLTIIPAAIVGAGGGGGGGTGEQAGTGSGSGEGGGFGFRAKPAGAFVVKQGKVRWQPAVDVNRIILGGQLVAVTALLVARKVMLSRVRLAQAQAEAAASSMRGRLARMAMRARSFR